MVMDIVPQGAGRGGVRADVAGDAHVNVRVAWTCRAGHSGGGNYRRGSGRLHHVGNFAAEAAPCGVPAAHRPSRRLAIRRLTSVKNHGGYTLKKNNNDKNK